MGLYYDDSLNCSENLKDSKVRRIRISFAKIFRNKFNHSFTSKTNLKMNTTLVNANHAIHQRIAYEPFWLIMTSFIRSFKTCQKILKKK